MRPPNYDTKRHKARNTFVHPAGFKVDMTIVHAFKPGHAAAIKGTCEVEVELLPLAASSAPTSVPSRNTTDMFGDVSRMCTVGRIAGISNDTSSRSLKFDADRGLETLSDTFVQKLCSTSRRFWRL